MNPLVQVVAVIPAAGSGRRMNANTNKIWLPLCGQTVLAHTVKVFQTSSSILHIVLAINQAETEDFNKFLTGPPISDFPNNSVGNVQNNEGQALQDSPEELTGKLDKITLVAGGAERQQSVANALQYLKSWPGWMDGARHLVVVHDAARALITADLLEKAISAGLNYRAIGVGVRVKDTIKQADNDGMVTETLERSRLWTIQTPQVFEFDLLLHCYEKVAGLPVVFSDDCGVVEYCGHPVKLIEGSYENLKITTPEDLVIAEAIIRRRTHGGEK